MQSGDIGVNRAKPNIFMWAKTGHVAYCITATASHANNVNINLFGSNVLHALTLENWRFVSMKQLCGKKWRIGLGAVYQVTVVTALDTKFTHGFMFTEQHHCYPHAVLAARQPV